jgi:rod shape-determining protein MreB
VGILRERIAIDLGTAYSIVAHESRRELWRIPSTIALDSRTRLPVAFGEQAKRMSGRENFQYEVIRPLKDGVISDFAAAGHYFSYLVKHSRLNPFALRYTVYVCIPWGATSVEMKSYVERVKSIRTKIQMIREPFAAALGADQDVFNSSGCTIVDIGGGTVEISTIAHGCMILCNSFREAGNAMDQLIVDRILRQRLFEVGLSTAEEIKMKFGSVFPQMNEQGFEVRGIDRKTRLPGRIDLTTQELRDFLDPMVQSIERRLRDHIRHLPEENKKNVYHNGIHMVGGGAHLRGWKERLEAHLEVPINIAADPQLAVIRGMKKMIDSPRKYRALLQISEKVNSGR